MSAQKLIYISVIVLVFAVGVTIGFLYKEAVNTTIQHNLRANCTVFCTDGTYIMKEPVDDLL